MKMSVAACPREDLHQFDGGLEEVGQPAGGLVYDQSCPELEADGDSAGGRTHLFGHHTEVLDRHEVREGGAG